MRIGAGFTAASLRFDETEKAGFEKMPGVAVVDGDYLVHGEWADGHAGDAAAAAAATAAKDPEEGVFIVGGSPARGAGTLASVEALSRMWPLGRVPFVVSIADGRTEKFVRDAVAHWEAKTCIEFTECATAAACPKPYIKFVSVSGCSAYMGMNKYGGVDVVDVSKMCMFGGAVHEIGHALGLNHEQSRNDRDEFVYINYGTIHPSVRANFEKAGEVGRDYGPYNYKSIMHYNAFSFTQRKTRASILSPYPVGQYNGLSDGDIDVIDWMYNGCRASYPKPSPMASRDVSRTHLVPHTKLFQTEFNVKYATDVVVAYATDAPASTVEYAVPAGGTMTPVVNNTFVRFVPTAAEAGREFAFTVTFTGKADGVSNAMTLRVKVAEAEYVCDGISASDPKVCNGRGTCDGGRRQPCTCRGSYGGHYCEGYQSCPNNYLYPNFAAGQDVWKLDGATSEWVPQHGGALEVGVDAAENRGLAKLGVIKRSQPRVVSWAMVRKLPDTSPGVVVEGLGGNCAAAVFRNGAWLFNGGATEGVPAAALEPGREVRFEVAFDWPNRRMALKIDGVAVSERAMGRCYGVDEVYVYGRVYLTSFSMTCFDATPSPPPPATPQPPVTLQPITPAPATRTPAPATPPPTAATPAPATDGDCVDKTPNGDRWYSGYGASYGCAYFGDARYIDQAPNRCGKWGGEKRNMGLVANEACCACGGGDVVGGETPAPAVPTGRPETATPAQQCADKTAGGGAAWHGSWGAQFGCTYFEGASYRCERFGDGGRNFGLVAKEACCHCGGGDRAAGTPAPVPVPETSVPPTPGPETPAPTTGAPGTACVDVTIDGRTWYSGYGEPYGCDYFASGARCERWGALKPSEGYVANTACCSCGGGVKGGVPVTKAPAPPPTAAPTTPLPPPVQTLPPTPEPPATPVPPIAGGAVTPVCPLEQALPKDRYGWAPQRVTSGMDADYTRGFRYGAEYGTGVDAYVLDSGTDCDHVEFEGRCSWGYMAASRSFARDRIGHGTHVAGIVGGKTHGLAKNVSIIAVKIIGDDGFGSFTTSIKAVEWVVAQVKKTNKPSVINMSVGGPKRDLYNAAINAAVAEGVTVVTASGNDREDACTKSPASATDAITVGMTNYYDNRNGYSNYGSCVDVMAPGEDVRSAWIGRSKAQTRVETGTSMAAPMVAGAVATFLSFNPTATPGQVHQWVMATAVETGLGRLKGSPDKLLQMPCVPAPRD